jgi:hypothetical protein
MPQFLSTAASAYRIDRIAAGLPSSAKTAALEGVMMLT